MANSRDLSGGFARLALEAQQATKRSLLLVLDQFEEYFLYSSDRMRSPAQRGISELLARRELDLRLLFGLRDDSLHLLDRLRAAIPGILDTTVRLGYLNEADVERAIRGPIRRYNERYRANAARVEIEDSLVEKVIRDLRESGGRSGAEETGKGSAQIELPYVQLTMTKLWDAEGGRSATKLNLDTLTQKLGGVQQIVRKHVDDVLGALPETDQALCADVFRYLVTPGGAKIAYPAADLAASVNEDRKDAGDGPVPDATTHEVEAVLRKLTPSKTRLLKPVKVKGADAFELFHDVLAQPVLQWRREFITNARLEQERRRLAAERDEKERRQREETARIAKRRGRYGAAALLLVASLAFGFFLLWNNASRQLDAAQRRVQELEQARKQHFEGLNAASRKEYASAISLFTQSLSVYQKYGQSSRMVHGKVDRGNVYALSGNIALAEKDIDQAIDTARQTQSADDKGLATESKASLHERLGKPDAAALYEEAGDSYQTAGDSLSVARILEWKGTRAETNRQFDIAADHYKGALERYRIAASQIGVARIEEAIHRVVPWGFFVDLKRGEVFPMRGKSISVGRNTDDGPQNEVSFSNMAVSRHHLLINREGFQAVDLRSTNGTDINAIPLPFEGSQALVDGDLVALANTEVLQFTTREQLPPTPPPAAWAIFINGSTRTYTYLTEKTYSLALTSRDLRVEPGENVAAILSLHGGQNPQLRYANSEWSVVFEYKKNDHEYGVGLVPAAKWVLIDNLPARFVKLSADRRQIVEEGPAFQIVTIAPESLRYP